MRAGRGVNDTTLLRNRGPLPVRKLFCVSFSDASRPCFAVLDCSADREVAIVFVFKWGLRNAIPRTGYRVRRRLGRHERRSLGAAAAVGAGGGTETNGRARFEISGTHARAAGDDGDDPVGLVR